MSDVVAFLDTLSRKLIPQLKYFVVLAPSVASRGAKAKSNYVLANTDVYKVAEVRKFSSYPAVSTLKLHLKQKIIKYCILLCIVLNRII